MSKKNQVTFGDIASYTGFSKTTISRFFNKPDTVTKDHQDRINEALAALGYKKNKVAQILAKGKTEFVGVILPTLSLHYFSEMLVRILNTYREYGYKFIVFTGSNHAEEEERYINELLAYQIEGLIVMNHTLPSEKLAACNIPVVTIEREDQFVSSVNCDNYMGGVQAVSLLAKHNCDILIHLNSPAYTEIPAYRRRVGFIDFCEENHLPYSLIIKDIGSTYETMYLPVKEAFDQMETDYPDKIKGVFCSNDTTANCLLNCIIRKYGTLPPQYRLVGFDNSPIAKEAIYTISTVGQQIDVIAREAVSLLAEKISMKRNGDPDAGTPVHKVITPVLYRRETTEGVSPERKSP